MNKRGFTLIELLAVIVILAIIALIAVPIVLNMIENARKSAAKSSAYGYIEAINNNNELVEMDEDYQTGAQEIKGTDIPVSSINLKLKGKKPDSGKVTITKGRVSSASLCINKYTVSYDGTEAKIVKKGCDESSTEQYVYSSFGDGENGDGVITSASQGRTARPTEYNTYLKYRLVDGEIASGENPFVCIYSERLGGELCLKKGEFETSKQKILDYFKWNVETNSSPYSGSNRYEGVYCDITVVAGETTSIHCTDNDSNVSAQALKDTYVAGFDNGYANGNCFDEEASEYDEGGPACYMQ